jgi:DHA1 family bicyclomycin/chloramphenicol resistance-like MFS transporter
MQASKRLKPVKTRPTLGLLEFVVLMASLTSMVALSIDAMLPALTEIGHALGSKDAHESHLIVSVFFIGMAFGQLYYGPASDAKGRRWAILSGIAIFMLGTVICMLAESMTVMLIGRIVQAFGVSGPRIASIALIRDQYAGEAMARVMSFIMMVFILVPMIAPAFGQMILNVGSWQYIFSSFLVISLALGVWFYIRQPETLPVESRAKFSWAALWKSSKYVLTHRKVMAYTLAMGFIFGAFLAYLSASQTIFQEIYQTAELFPLYFAVLAFSIGFASFVNGALVMRMGMHRLSYLALVGMVVCSIVLLALAFHYAGIPPLWMFITTLFVTFFFIGILFGNLNAMAMVPLGDMAGVGAAIIGSLSSLFSVPIAIFVSSFIQDSITPIAIGFTLFGVIATATVAVARPAKKIR